MSIRNDYQVATEVTSIKCRKLNAEVALPLYVIIFGCDKMYIFSHYLIVTWNEDDTCIMPSLYMIKRSDHESEYRKKLF